MFTGIIEAVAPVVSWEKGRLRLARPGAFEDMDIGSSICVSGVCLTIVSLDHHSMHFDVTQETVNRTTLGSFQEGRRVNLERALRVGDRFEGHVVQGHIEGVGEVAKVMNVSKGAEVMVRYPKEFCEFIVEKGSVALDGVSLTVTGVDSDTFSVALIPQTIAMTTLGELREGDSVNLEADILGKYVSSGGPTRR